MSISVLENDNILVEIVFDLKKTAQKPTERLHGNKRESIFW